MENSNSAKILVVGLWLIFISFVYVSGFILHNEYIQLLWSEKIFFFLHQCRYQPRYSQQDTNHPEGTGSSGNGGVGSEIEDSEVSHRLAQEEVRIIPLDKERHQCSGLRGSWDCLAGARIMVGAFLVGARATKSYRGEPLPPHTHCQRSRRGEEKEKYFGFSFLPTFTVLPRLPLATCEAKGQEKRKNGCEHTWETDNAV